MTFKHVVDWLVALAAATILMPVLLLISLLIVLDSRGSPIFRQRRIGYRGQPFVVWKFRTMSVTDIDESGSSDARTAAMTASNAMSNTRIERFPSTSRPPHPPPIPPIP